MWIHYKSVNLVIFFFKTFARFFRSIFLIRLIHHGQGAHFFESCLAIKCLTYYSNMRLKKPVVPCRKKNVFVALIPLHDFGNIICKNAKYQIAAWLKLFTLITKIFWYRRRRGFVICKKECLCYYCISFELEHYYLTSQKQHRREAMATKTKLEFVTKLRVIFLREMQ